MTSQPHDRLAKAVFSETRQASAFFEAFLPADISAQIDFDSLELVSGSFVDEELTERLTDLLFTARIGRDDLLIYLLHRSTPNLLDRHLQHRARLLHSGDEAIWRGLSRSRGPTRLDRLHERLERCRKLHSELRVLRRARRLPQSPC